MKAIILAGGKGTRLYPSTKTVSKQLLPIYDKPLIYYPLSVLILMDIKDVLIISTPDDTPQYKHLLGDGSRIGISIEYAVQETPRGLADAFILGEEFCMKNGESICLILGDNVFYGQGFGPMLENAKKRVETSGGASIFGYPVVDPTEFGVVEFDDAGKVISIEEKPNNPKSKYAVPGLYFYDSNVVEIAKNLKPSARGEIEITAINHHYLKEGKLYVTLLGRGMSWIDTGSADRMHKASAFVQSVQEMQGFYIGCIEEIAWRKGYISTKQLIKLGEELKMTEYGQYMLTIAKEGDR